MKNRFWFKNRKIIVLTLSLFLTIIFTSHDNKAPVQAGEMRYTAALPAIKREVNRNSELPPTVVPDRQVTATPTHTPPSGPSLPLTPTPSTVIPTATPQPIASPTPVPLQLGNGSRLGVWAGDAYGNVTTRLKESGGKWTRIMVFWSEIEPTYTQPATYDFSKYDRIFSSLSQAGITSIAEIRWNPTWAATTLCGPIDKDSGIAGFERFVEALVQRYKEAPYNVKQWEFYNEPDNKRTTGIWSQYCACFGDYPSEYVEMLRTAHGAVKSVDPEAKVLVGGLAYENEPGNFNIDFLNLMLAAGGGQYFDVMNVHYYSSQSGNWANYGRDIKGKVTSVRQVMARYNLDKPVAVTESGWTSSDPLAADFGERQARYVPKVLARSLALNLYASLWFSIADWNGADVLHGLTDVNLNPKESFTAYRTAALEFGNARSVRELLPWEVGARDTIEGYVFDVNGQARWVLWSEGNPISIDIPHHALEATNKYGQIVQLNGNGTPTRILLDDSPIFVRF